MQRLVKGEMELHTMTIEYVSSGIYHTSALQRMIASHQS
jgi:hypothetical protein